MVRRFSLMVWVMISSLTAMGSSFTMDEINQKAANDTAIAIKNNYFEQLKSRVFSDEYSELPQYKVTRKLFDRGGKNLLLADAIRTLRSKDDLIEFPAGQKLLQANGICLAGTWRMNHRSIYSGLFASNVELAVIARASVSLSGTRQRHKRAFAVALKLFPETADGERVTTENIFLMHTLGGVVTRSVYSLSLDNQPELGSLPPFSQWLTAHRLERDLEKADQSVSKGEPDARFRPVSHLAKVNVKGQIVTEPIKPYWLQLRPRKDLALDHHDDFRDELNVEHYPDNVLVWDVHAASYTASGKSKAKWKRIGEVSFTESVVSKSCDTELHFSHPIKDQNE